MLLYYDTMGRWTADTKKIHLDVNFQVVTITYGVILSSAFRCLAQWNIPGAVWNSSSYYSFLQ